MSERSPEALEAALAMLRRPQLVRFAQRSSLPRGVTFLLEIAVGEPEALREAQRSTGSHEARLREAAGFFVEQVLLDRQASSYRKLGSSPSASSSELRRHMALILRWLHPDVVDGAAAGQHFDRSAYVNLVTEAWETLKTDSRRAAYDATQEVQARGSRNRRASGGLNGAAMRQPGHGASSGGGRRRQLVLVKIRRETIWRRLLLYLESLK
ncbi:MAG: hypothetical protein ACLPWS_03600 [Rhodomicrobium sp.]